MAAAAAPAAPAARTAGADPDADLVALVRAGQRHLALHRLVERYGDAVDRYCKVTLRDAARAEDVRQKVFIEALRDLPTFAGHAPLRMWLFAIARHRVQDDIRAETRMQANLQRVALYRPASWAEPLDEQLNTARLLVALELSLAQLPGDIHRAVRMRFLHGLSYAEMSAICGEKAGTLQARVKRAIPKLQAHIARHYDHTSRAA